MSSSGLERGVVLPVAAPIETRRELLKGCTFFVGLVATLAAINGTLLLIGRVAEGRSVLLFSAGMWVAWIAMRVVSNIRERARVAQPSGHVRLTSNAIRIPTDTGVEAIRWTDLKELRLTRDTAGNVFYEFYADDERPVVILDRSRLKKPEVLDRELETRGVKIEQTFEWKRPAPSASLSPTTNDAPLSGERFSLNLPATGWHTVRGCGGLLVVLAALFAVALRFPDFAMRWIRHPAFFLVLIASLLLGIFLATRSRKAWVVCAPDGLHVRAPGMRFPRLIRWGELRDYTFVATGRRNVSWNVTVWTAEGSWKLKGIGIENKKELVRVLSERSARKPETFYEQHGGSMTEFLSALE